MLEEYKQLSPSEFFYRNKEIAGFSNPSRSLYTSIRELFENSMDACELNGILPEIIIFLRRIRKSEKGEVYKLYIQDNGSGIPKKHILNALGTVLYSSKYVIRQSRGTFGLGGTLALLYGQITTGKPVKVISSTGNSQIHQYTFKIDIRTNNPVVYSYKAIRNNKKWRGTIIEFYLEGNYSIASRYIVSYLKLTAAITPYADILFVDPNGTLYYFPRTVNRMPKPPKIIKPHPHGIDLEFLKYLISTFPKTMTIKEFLTKAFHRVGETTALKFLQYAKIKPTIRLGAITEDILDKLYNALRTYDKFISPSADVLSPIGEDILIEGIKKEFKPEYVDVVSRTPSSYRGHPFIIEAGIAYGGELPGQAGDILLFRYANKIPLLFDEGSDVSYKVLDRLRQGSYRIQSDKPIAVFIHIASTKIPFKSVGKEAIADVPEIEKEIELALKILFRRFLKYRRKIIKKKEVEKRLKIYERYIHLISRFSGKLADREPADVEKLLEKVKMRYGVKEKIESKSL